VHSPAGQLLVQEVMAAFAVSQDAGFV